MYNCTVPGRSRSSTSYIRSWGLAYKVSSQNLSRSCFCEALIDKRKCWDCNSLTHSPCLPLSESFSTLQPMPKHGRLWKRELTLTIILWSALTGTIFAMPMVRRQDTAFRYSSFSRSSQSKRPTRRVYLDKKSFLTWSFHLRHFVNYSATPLFHSMMAISVMAYSTTLYARICKWFLPFPSWCSASRTHFFFCVCYRCRSSREERAEESSYGGVLRKAWRWWSSLNSKQNLFQKIGAAGDLINLVISSNSFLPKLCTVLCMLYVLGASYSMDIFCFVATNGFRYLFLIQIFKLVLVILSVAFQHSGLSLHFSSGSR